MIQSLPTSIGRGRNWRKPRAAAVRSNISSNVDQLRRRQHPLERKGPQPAGWTGEFAKAPLFEGPLDRTLSGQTKRDEPAQKWLMTHDYDLPLRAEYVGSALE